MTAIHCTTPLVRIDSWTILRLPARESAKLPSRGIVMVRGQLNGIDYAGVLEPDGEKSHWLRITPALGKKMKAGAGDKVRVELEVSDDWVEPAMPADFKKALSSHPKAQATWKATTPNARWDWIRWMRATASAQTREKRIRSACDMLGKGKKRVCCFDRAKCTEMKVCHRGVLVNGE